MDETVISELPEVATPEQDQIQEEALQAEQEVQASPPPEDPQERNWRNARQKMQEQSQQIELLKQKLEQMQSPKTDPQPEEDLTDDDFVRGYHLKKKLEAMEKALQKTEAENAISRVKDQFSDFDQVVSFENVELLKQNDPELAISLKALANDPYAQALATYKLLKRTDYSQQKQSMENKQRIDKNIKKPPSINSVASLAEANRFANGLTPELKKALQKEMNDAAKRRTW
jgi:hypothetical protein